MKELCPIQIMVQGPLTPIRFFDHNLRFIGLFGVKLVPLERDSKSFPIIYGSQKLDLK